MEISDHVLCFKTTDGTPEKGTCVINVKSRRIPHNEPNFHVDMPNFDSSKFLNFSPPWSWLTACDSSRQFYCPTMYSLCHC